MIHALLAAIFCTIGIVSLFVESLPRGDGNTGLSFAFFYSLSTLAWLVLGVVFDNSGLVLTSLIQFFFLFCGAYCSFQNKRRVS